MTRALVRNAADPEQVGKAKQSERFAADGRSERIKVVGSTYQGRQFLWDAIGDCKVHESIMQTSAMIYYNAGRQDVGHKWMADIMLADPKLWLQMQAEAIQRDENAREPERKVESDGN